jgi:hypothetical protein
MELIERYVYQVVKRLPLGQREDVAKELRVTIEDMAQGKLTEQGVGHVLTELGDPASLAQKYQETPNYLIGPEYYEAYKDTLVRIMILVIPTAYVANVIVKFLLGHTGIPGLIFGQLGFALEVGLHIFFWITLVFFIIERSGSSHPESWPSKKHAWTPSMLPALPVKTQIGITEGILSATWSAAVVIVLLLSRNVLGIRANNEVIPFFHPDLWNAWLPILIGVSILMFGLEVAKTKIGEWKAWLVTGSILLNTAFLGAMVAIVTTQTVVNPAFSDTLSTSSQIRDVPQLLEYAIYITLLITAVSCVYESVMVVIKNRKLNSLRA